MTSVKILGLLTAAAVALMAFAGTASAHVSTSLGTVSEIEATSQTFTQIENTPNFSCEHTQIRLTLVDVSNPAHPTKAGSTFATVATWDWSNCTRSVTVTNTGTITISSNGELKSSGARITVQTTILGFPVHCIFATNNTKIGTLTEGVSPPVWHIGSSPIPQEATSGACGNDAVLTGSYTVTKPTGAITVS